VSPRHFVVVIAATFFVACTTPQNEWKSAGYYITDQSIYGCDSFEGKKGTAVKQTAVLSLGLQRKLLELLDHAASADTDLQKELDDFREGLMCWYETPEKNVELSLGAHCESPFQITFHPHGGEWSISSASRAIVLCHTRRR